MSQSDPTPPSPAAAPAARSPLLGVLRACAGALSRLSRPMGAVLATAWYGVIFTLSSNPGTGRPGPIAGGWILNTGHALLFGLLALWILLAFPRDGAWPRVRPAGGALLLGLVAALGALDEWHQSTVPGRSTSLTDVLTDLTGAACVLWTCAVASRAAADERGVRRTLAWGVVACCAAGGLATYADSVFP